MPTLLQKCSIDRINLLYVYNSSLISNNLYHFLSSWKQWTNNVNAVTYMWATPSIHIIPFSSNKTVNQNQPHPLYSFKRPQNVFNFSRHPNLMKQKRMNCVWNVHKTPLLCMLKKSVCIFNIWLCSMRAYSRARYIHNKYIDWQNLNESFIINYTKNAVDNLQFTI